MSVVHRHQQGGPLPCVGRRALATLMVIPAFVVLTQRQVVFVLRARQLLISLRSSDRLETQQLLANQRTSCRTLALPSYGNG